VSHAKHFLLSVLAHTVAIPRGTTTIMCCRPAASVVCSQTQNGRCCITHRKTSCSCTQCEGAKRHNHHSHAHLPAASAAFHSSQLHAQMVCSMLRWCANWHKSCKPTYQLRALHSTAASSSRSLYGQRPARAEHADLHSACVYVDFSGAMKCAFQEAPERGMIRKSLRVSLSLCLRAS